jgi:hypothetical protein
MTFIVQPFKAFVSILISLILSYVNYIDFYTSANILQSYYVIGLLQLYVCRQNGFCAITFCSS